MSGLSKKDSDNRNAEARLGTRLGNYALISIVGAGGMGVVYEGRHVYLRRRVAVKVMYKDLFTTTEARSRFLGEAQASGAIDHPNVVYVSDCGEAPDGTLFLVMGFVEGRPLEEILKEQPSLPLFRTLVILSQVARGLGAAHEQGVVHRDLKPENIMLQARPGRREVVRSQPDAHGQIELVEPEGSFDFATLLDFGAATIRGGGTARNRDGTIVATPYYMAPETALNGAADLRADVYALGVIFYRMLTGTLPFSGDEPREVMRQHAYAAVEPPSVRNPNVEVTPQAEQLILKALQKDPARRQQSMNAFYSELQHCFGQVRFRRINYSAAEQSPLPLVRAGSAEQTASDPGRVPSSIPARTTGYKPVAEALPLRTGKAHKAAPLSAEHGASEGPPPGVPERRRPGSQTPGAPLLLTRRKSDPGHQSNRTHGVPSPLPASPAGTPHGGEDGAPDTLADTVRETSAYQSPEVSVSESSETLEVRKGYETRFDAPPVVATNILKPRDIEPTDSSAAEDGAPTDVAETSTDATQPWRSLAPPLPGKR